MVVVFAGESQFLIHHPAAIHSSAEQVCLSTHTLSSYSPSLFLSLHSNTQVRTQWQTNNTVACAVGAFLLVFQSALQYTGTRARGVLSSLYVGVRACAYVRQWQLCAACKCVCVCVCFVHKCNHKKASKLLSVGRSLRRCVGINVLKRLLCVLCRGVVGRSVIQWQRFVMWVLFG